MTVMPEITMNVIF